MRSEEFSCDNELDIKGFLKDNARKEIRWCDVTQYLDDVTQNDIRKSAEVLKTAHATVESKIDGRICNGALLTSSWMVTSGSCLSEELGLLSGTNKDRVKLKINRNERAHIRKIKFHPEYRQDARYDFALIKFEILNNLPNKHFTMCIPNKEQLEILPRLLQRSAFTTWLGYPGGRRRLKTWLGVVTDYCVRQFNDIAGTKCAKIINSNRENNSTEMYISGAPFYSGYGNHWSLLGLAMYPPHVNGTEVRVIPLWNIVDFIVDTMHKDNTRVDKDKMGH